MNLYFFVMFGNNVEDYLGRTRFLLLLLLATLGGFLAHFLGNPASMIPCYGASAAIAGVMACYVFAFPRAQFAMMIIFFRGLGVHWLRIPAYLLIICWVVLQLLLARPQLAGLLHISILAHLGGAAVGVFCWLFWHDSAGAAGARGGSYASKLPFSRGLA